MKGGLALQLRLGDSARTTKDIDLLVLVHQQDIFSTLRNAGALDLGDWFLIEVAESTKQVIDDFGGMRFHLHSRLDGRGFENFHIDVGVGDPLLDPVDLLKTPALLDFADIQPTVVPCYPLTQQIAEKLHAYTRTHPSGGSTRVKDLVDILLMAEFGEIDGVKLLQALLATFDARQTHILPIKLVDPPKEWSTLFRKLSDEVPLGYTTLGKASEAMLLRCNISLTLS